MAKYDPNWLRKSAEKKISKDLANLSHVIAHGSTALCGKYTSDGNTKVLQHPSPDHLPSCATCREKFLEILCQSLES